MRTARSILSFMCAAIVFLTAASEGMAVDSALNPKQQSIIAISSFTANGNLEKLKGALNEGLDAGLTVNEIKEILVQLYAYAGFPRSLNGINTFMAVMDERKAKGISDKEGREASPMPANWNRDEYGAQVRARLGGRDTIPAPSGYQLFAPVIDTFLKEHLFGDIFGRDVLSFQERELATVSALASLPAEAQLRSHLNCCLTVGWSEDQMKAFVAVLEAKVGKAEAELAETALNTVLQNRIQSK